MVDVLFHLPQGTIDRRARPKIRDAVPGAIVTIEARVTEHREPHARSRAPFKVLVEDDTGDVELVFFLANHEWVRSRLPVGATRWISGKLELWDGRRQMVHPDRVMNAEELDRLPSVEPVYGLTEGLYQRAVARAAEGALKRLPQMPEWIGDKTLSDLKLPSFTQALSAMHRPGTPGDIDPAGPAATRLAYDELSRQPARAPAHAGAHARNPRPRACVRRRFGAPPRDRPALFAHARATPGGRRNPR